MFDSKIHCVGCYVRGYMVRLVKVKKSKYNKDILAITGSQKQCPRCKARYL